MVKCTKISHIFCRKCLTKVETDGILSKLSGSGRPGNRVKAGGLKKLEKNLKKFLTNETLCARINQLSDERRKAGGQRHIKKNLKKLEKSS